MTAEHILWRKPTPDEHSYPRPSGPYWRVVDIPPVRQVREYNGVRISLYAVLEQVCPHCRRPECSTCLPQVEPEWSLIVDSIDTAEEAVQFARTWRRGNEGTA